jgi:hypothetical protein
MKMKAKRVEVTEVEGTGMIGLLGKRVVLMCLNYIYEGVLDGVDETVVALSDAGIVYETGSWQHGEWENREALPAEQVFVRIDTVEAFFENTK